MKRDHLVQILISIMFLQLCSFATTKSPTQTKPDFNSIDSQLRNTLHDVYPDGISNRISQTLEADEIAGLINSTLIGGTRFERIDCMAIDDMGYVYIAGATYSSDFPTTPHAFDQNYYPSYGGYQTDDIFVCKISADLSNLIYSTYMGTRADEWVTGIAVDKSGCAYITGCANEYIPTHFTTEKTIFNGSNGKIDSFVCKLNENGSKIEYFKLIGGTQNDFATDIVIDDLGYAYICGNTESYDFPTTYYYRNSQDDFETNDHLYPKSFICKINPEGTTLNYSIKIASYGSIGATGITIDNFGSVYITGSTYNNTISFPTTPGAYQEKSNGYLDIYVCKITNSGSMLNYSTLIGGSNRDFSNSIEIDDSGYAYICGSTYDNKGDFPTTKDAYDSSHNGEYDAIVCKLNPEGTALNYSTLIGGKHNDEAKGIVIDDLGYAYIVGETFSSNFPSTPGTHNMHDSRMYDAFVCKLNPNGTTLEYSAEIGGKLTDQGNAIALDNHGHVYIAGETSSLDFPTTHGALYETHKGNVDVFVCKLKLIPGKSSIPSYPLNILILGCIPIIFYLKKKYIK